MGQCAIFISFMEILHLKGVAFSRPEAYKGGGGSSFMERGAIMEFFIEGGRHVFFLLVF